MRRSIQQTAEAKFSSPDRILSDLRDASRFNPAQADAQAVFNTLQVSLDYKRSAHRIGQQFIELLFELPRSITRPRCNHFSFGRNQDIMGNPLDTVINRQSGQALRIPQVHPLDPLLCGILFPTGFPVLGNADHRQHIPIDLSHSSHLRHGHPARAATDAPEIEQQVFAFVIS